MSDSSSDVYVEDLDDAWGEASDTGGPAPDGLYRVQSIDSKFRHAANGGRYFDLISEVLTGDDAGRKITRSYGLKPNVLFWLKGDCKRMGHPFERLSDLRDEQHVLYGIEMDWLLKTSAPNEAGKSYQNITITKVYGVEPPAKEKPKPKPAPAARPRSNEPPPPSDHDAPDNW